MNERQTRWDDSGKALVVRDLGGRPDAAKRGPDMKPAIVEPLFPVESDRSDHTVRRYRGVTGSRCWLSIVARPTRYPSPSPKG